MTRLKRLGDDFLQKQISDKKDMAKKSDIEDLKEQQKMMKEFVSQTNDLHMQQYRHVILDLRKIETIVYNRDEPFLEKYTNEFIKHKEDV